MIKISNLNISFLSTMLIVAIVFPFFSSNVSANQNSMHELIERKVDHILQSVRSNQTIPTTLRSHSSATSRFSIAKDGSLRSLGVAIQDNWSC